MAVVYNDKVCVAACELIRGGAGTGFIAEATYYTMVRRGQLTVARRSAPGTPALIEFDTMRPDIKQQYTQAHGDPYADLAARSDLRRSLRIPASGAAASAASSRTRRLSDTRSPGSPSENHCWSAGYSAPNIAFTTRSL